MHVNLLSCPICGAVIGIKIDEQDGKSTADLHRRWHERNGDMDDE